MICETRRLERLSFFGCRASAWSTGPSRRSRWKRTKCIAVHWRWNTFRQRPTTTTTSESLNSHEPNLRYISHETALRCDIFDFLRAFWRWHVHGLESRIFLVERTLHLFFVVPSSRLFSVLPVLKINAVIIVLIYCLHASLLMVFCLCQNLVVWLLAHLTAAWDAPALNPCCFISVLFTKTTTMQLWSQAAHLLQCVGQVSLSTSAGAVGR